VCIQGRPAEEIRVLLRLSRGRFAYAASSSVLKDGCDHGSGLLRHALDLSFSSITWLHSGSGWRSLSASSSCIVASSSAEIGSTASERQIQDNDIFDGENDLTGFGQMAALLLTLAPVWSLVVAIYKYPAILDRKRRRLRRQRATEPEHHQRPTEDDELQSHQSVLDEAPRRMDGHDGISYFSRPRLLSPPGFYLPTPSGSSAISDFVDAEVLRVPSVTSPCDSVGGTGQDQTTTWDQGPQYPTH
jgi:hypothetical protein